MFNEKSRFSGVPLGPRAQWPIRAAPVQDRRLGLPGDLAEQEIDPAKAADLAGNA